jgi:UDP-galactopyranose mutase
VALVRSIGYRLGGTPETTPALAAVELSVSRTFGRWQLQPLGGSAGDPGRSSVLIEALVARLALRRVVVHLENPVLGITIDRSRATGIRTAEGSKPASAVVVTIDPWRTAADLLPAAAARRTGRGLRRLRPARGPHIMHRTSPEPAGGVEETVSLSVEGVPVVSYRRPVGTGTLECRHDFSRGIAAARYGAEWQGLASWLRRPRVTGEVEGLFAAGPWSAAGPGPSQVVLSGALAAYAGHAYLGGAG